MKKNIVELHQLIQNTTKAERRNFKMYTKDLGSKDAKYLQLFDLLARDSVYGQKKVAPLLKKKGLSMLNAFQESWQST
ncbi:MAG: hypothetical protein GY810_28840 [Aureispira sp.]|nr:hypothetical protein [Aureispira sp.]